MDKYEFNLKVEKIKQLSGQNDFATAAKIADSIDWRRVRSVSLLTTVADVYEENGEYQEAIEVLLIAFERNPSGRYLLYKMTILALKVNRIQEAEAYYTEFCDLAGDDFRKYLLQYMILKEKGASNHQLAPILEKYLKEELDEKWMCELADIYAQEGQAEKCVTMCDRIALMFGAGEYVGKALEIKMRFAPLTQYQLDLLNNREKYEQKLQEVERDFQARQGLPTKVRREGYAPAPGGAGESQNRPIESATVQIQEETDGFQDNASRTVNLQEMITNGGRPFRTAQGPDAGPDVARGPIVGQGAEGFANGPTAPWNGKYGPGPGMPGAVGYGAEGLGPEGPGPGNFATRDMADANGMAGPQYGADPSQADGSAGMGDSYGMHGSAGMEGSRGMSDPRGMEGSAGMTGYPGMSGPRGMEGSPGMADPRGVADPRGMADPPGMADPRGMADPHDMAGSPGVAAPRGMAGGQDMGETTHGPGSGASHGDGHENENYRLVRRYVKDDDEATEDYGETDDKSDQAHVPLIQEGRILLESDSEPDWAELANWQLKCWQEKTRMKRMVIKTGGYQLSKKGVENCLDRLAGKSLVVEHAGEMTADTVMALDEWVRGIDPTQMVILIDCRKQLYRLKADFPWIVDSFGGDPFESPSSFLRQPFELPPNPEDAPVVGAPDVDADGGKAPSADVNSEEKMAKGTVPETQEETPQVQMPQDQMPQVQTPQDQMPQVEMPQAQTPPEEMPQAQTPPEETPQAQMHLTQMPHEEMPQEETPRDSVQGRYGDVHAPEEAQTDGGEQVGAAPVSEPPSDGIQGEVRARFGDNGGVVPIGLTSHSERYAQAYDEEDSAGYGEEYDEVYDDNSSSDGGEGYRRDYDEVYDDNSGPAGGEGHREDYQEAYDDDDGQEYGEEYDEVYDEEYEDDGAQGYAGAYDDGQVGMGGGYDAPAIQAPPANQLLSARDFLRQAREYATSIDCEITKKGLRSLEERVEVMEEDGIPLTVQNAVDLIESAADKAEKKRLFVRQYNKAGLLLLRDGHFWD
ncbi:MAG: hypothetical protein LBR77_09800 [Lachnospiraceae bacterium]|jgi:tetratricopeptide (TPR) repeat protein|nr:hypothetical protein [Lachnospiraceae bacterium]